LSVWRGIKQLRETSDVPQKESERAGRSVPDAVLLPLRLAQTKKSQGKQSPLEDTVQALRKNTRSRGEGFGMDRDKPLH